MTDTPTIFQLLVAVQADIDHISKGDKHDFHKYMFRGVDSVINTVGPILRRHGVLCIPHLEKLESRDVPTKNGTAREVTVEVTYTFYGPAGDSLPCLVPGEAQDSGGSGVTKAMSVAHRDCLLQSFNIPTEVSGAEAKNYTRREESAYEGWKQKVWDEAQKRGWDVDVLAQAYAEFTSDADVAVSSSDIRDAGIEELKAYHQHLVPPRKAQRAAS